jgi:hypothetical protein
MYSLRTLSVIVALGLLVAVIGMAPAFFGANSVIAATVTVAEDDVEFAAANGDDVSSAKPNSTSTIFILDGALETTKSGTAVFSGNVTSSKFFDIANGKHGAATPGNAATTFTLTAVGYSTSSPSTTPLTGNPAATVGLSSSFVVGSVVASGSFTLLAAADATTTATFAYHTQDSWSGTDSTLRRAKVTSTSDPAGEWVTISEVASLTDGTANATSKLFSGIIFLSSDAATQGTNSDGVWVQDGDTLTANYYDSAAVLIDSDTVTIDGVKPTIAAVSPADGTITNVANPTVTFDVSDTGSGISTTDFATDITLAINGVTVSGTSISYQAIANGFRAIFAQGTAWTNATSSDSTVSGFAVTDSLEFSLEITATDEAGNTQTVTGTSANVTIDKTVPLLVSATTGSANTAVVVTFSDTSGLDAASVDADGSDFTLVGATISAAVVDSSDSNKVNLTVGAMASDAKPTVQVTGAITDKAANAASTSATAVTATDGVKAVLSSVAIDKGLAILADKVTVTLSTDEKMAVDWPLVTVAGPSGATANGAKTPTSPTPNNFSADATIAAGDTTGVYGISIQAKDLGNNLTTNLTTVTAESPTISTDRLTLTLANGPIGDSDFSGIVGASDVTVFRNATTTGAPAVTAVDASARTITLGSAATSTTGVAYTVTYDYVATDTFQVDQSAPTVTFDPNGTADVQNQSPFVRVIFDEDEYPGDSHKTVTLTKAELTNPDATTLDVLASFSTGDSIEYIWAASNLALGNYTLTVSATDTAGNKLTDATGTFTIAKRTVSIALRPGWNLVSLPDSPAADLTGINDVITTDKVDIVLTYDPTTAGNWLVATRQTDGTLGGGDSALALTTITANRAYWVHSTAVVTLKVDVPGIAAGAASLPPSFKLIAGWNLVPVATSDLTMTSRDADDYFSGLDWSRAYGYDNASNKFVGLLPDTSMTAGDTVAVNKGYWVFLNKAGTLVP